MRFLTAFAAATVLTPVLGWLGRRLGLVDRPGDLKIHERPVPLTGGVAVVGATLGTLAAFGGAPSAAVVGATLLALSAGLVDDVRPLSPWLRLAVIVVVGGILAAAGLRVIPFGPLAAAGVVVVVIACTNGVNLLDGQDGLSGGVGAAAAGGIAALAAIGGGGQAGTALPLAVAGALLGFVVWNRPPARVFLGNGGAYAVGTLLAVAAVTSAGPTWRGVLAAGTCLGILVFEFTFTLARRLRSRTNVAAGDRLHSYDLMAQQMGRTASTFAFWGLAVLAVGLGVAVAILPLTAGLAAIGAGGLGGALLLVQLWALRPRPSERLP